MGGYGPGEAKAPRPGLGLGVLPGSATTSGFARRSERRRGRTGGNLWVDVHPQEAGLWPTMSRMRRNPPPDVESGNQTGNETRRLS
jgi:hypothetical protein